MTNNPAAILAKLHHLYQFGKSAFAESNALVNEARQISLLGLEAPTLLTQSNRDDLQLEHLDQFVAHIYGIYYSSLAHFEALQTLALSGHALDAMVLLRPQLECVLAFLFVTEPERDLHEIEARVTRHRDWVIVRMKDNLDKSSRFAAAQIVLKDGDFTSTLEESYKTVADSFAHNPAELSKLEKNFSFLSPNEREAIASKYEMLDLYHHVFAESSASIHFADIGDRMTKLGPLHYQYHLRVDQGAFWPLMLSNLLQVRCIQRFGSFFDIRSQIDPRLRTIFKGDHDAS